MIVRELGEIDLKELIRLHICESLGDFWTWVAQGPDRQQVVEADAPEGAEAPPTKEEARLEEEVHGIQVILGEQREVVNVMARDLSRLTVWAAEGISHLLDSAGAAYTRYSETHVPYKRRRVRQRAREASTLAVSLDEDQPDP
ncbi:hypothetical protein Tco_0169856 [Tanacetum coccineum]